MRFLPVNRDAMLVELADLDDTLALLDSLNAHPIHGVEELVPAARTILVTFRPGAVSAAQIADNIRGRDLGHRTATVGQLVEIPVAYTGDDLHDVAGLLGVSADEVVAMHAGSEYTVAFTGFAPGFAYLTGGHPLLDVPRRAVPRTRIPAGAVGLAGMFSGVYPQASPGGWQIIGVTDVPMWDLAREVPALLQPGYRVKFVPVTEQIAVAAGDAQSEASTPEASTPEAKPESAVLQGLRMRATGIQTVVQDLGRPGQAGQGVSASGALDRTSLRVANRLVGNASDEACLETVDGGLRLESIGDNVVAVAGASTLLTLLAADGTKRQRRGYEPIVLEDGDQLLLSEPERGTRSYVAVRGGFDLPPILGSRATDTLANIGPAPLVPGAVIPVRQAVGGAAIEPLLTEPPQLPSAAETVTLDVVMGPRDDWFTPDAVATFGAQTWRVTAQSNRVGLRLSAEVPLERSITTELPSEGTAVGAIQVPASGQPVLFLADHPLTGGYPVIGSVATYHLNLAGQIPIGAGIRFNPISDVKDSK
ncbi:5-oxoprolinase subunit B/C family protein [Lysinibacter cavernae]|uniref:KipI family sensor histidine kinase inhibitor n=1 Tax=Lysinibacter cavernae TaxID=1640652 RepID=A0A7X5TU66_9MICO|nr:carboxyltransferase domain-containing protein [Lysinibacter cavernae]NIH54925.1 KipI family sensor histidine kinase inhibitor [Lysinibacter cavernae]